MKGTILEKIVATRRLRVEAAKAAADVGSLTEIAKRTRSGAIQRRFASSLSDRSLINTIAEFKRASPSKGVINNMADPAEMASAYSDGGAYAISVLTEEDHFGGSLDDLIRVRAAVDLPILRKDFIFDEFQIVEAAAAGADAILLIASMLNDTEIARLRSLAEDEFGLDALIEVHSFAELERAERAGAGLIGVNNRDLHSFDVSLDVSRDLIKHAPSNAIMVAESGLRTHEDLIELQRLGYSGFLIGESLMRSSDPAAELRKLNGKG